VTESREIQVHMCQIGIGGHDDVLRTTLGSCVGIGLLWRARAVYGLAHCLLPEAPALSSPASPSDNASAKYVTQAIPSLLQLMQVQRASYGELEAVVAGGANMVHYVRRPSHAPIGEQNARTAQRLLDALGVRIVHTDVGGESGRQLLIDCRQHTFVVKKIARPL
jgi:chemotaxis protein CheD